jgi:hypothetical protein
MRTMRRRTRARKDRGCDCTLTLDYARRLRKTFHNRPTALPKMIRFCAGTTVNLAWSQHGWPSLETHERSDTIGQTA